MVVLDHTRPAPRPTSPGLPEAMRSGSSPVPGDLLVGLLLLPGGAVWNPVARGRSLARKMLRVCRLENLCSNRRDSSVLVSLQSWATGRASGNRGLTLQVACGLHRPKDFVRIAAPANKLACDSYVVGKCGRRTGTSVRRAALPADWRLEPTREPSWASFSAAQLLFPHGQCRCSQCTFC